MMYFTLAYIGYWQLGATIEGFGSLMDAALRQFEMVVGEFPWDSAQALDDTSLIIFFIYVMVFAIFAFFNISTDVAVNYVSLYLTKAEEMAMARTDMDNFQVHKYDVQARVEERREKLFRLGVAVEDKRSASDGGGGGRGQGA